MAVCLRCLLGLFLLAHAHAASVPRFNHVVVVILENHSPGDIYGSSSAPYINNTLIAQGVKFTHSANPPGQHPSQPNYITLVAGDNMGVVSDMCPISLTGSNLAQQLIDAGLRFAQYSENLPAVGDTSCSAANGAYVRWHNAVSDYASLPISTNLPFSQFATDLSNGDLPTVSFVVPNICNDMEGDLNLCNPFFTDVIQLGDTWLNNNIAAFLAAPIARNSLLIVTWDEGSGSLTVSDQIPTIFAGAHIQHGYVSNVAITHYNMLRTLEDMYSLVPLRNAAVVAPISDVWDDVIFADMFE